MSVIDEAITALARHYGVTEAEITEDLVDMSEGLPAAAFPWRTWQCHSSSH